MAFHNHLADLVTRLNGAFVARKEIVYVPYVKFNLRILRLLMDHGCIKTFYIDYCKKTGNLIIRVSLKYVTSLPLVRRIELISTPGNRVYWGVDALSKNFGKSSFQGFYVVSTSGGLCTSSELLLSRVLTRRASGEILLKVYF